MSRLILVVDDEPDIRELARLSLERVGGHRVVAAGSGAEAVSLATESHPDGVILDVQMPGMDGPATLAALRASAGGAGVPVIFLTASVQESQLADLEALDVAAVLTKPFDPMTLSADVGRIFGWAG